MKDYRAYLLDRQGNILHREEIQAKDDAAAITAGWDRVDAHKADQPEPTCGLEIWHGRQLVFTNHSKDG
jgi:hypothetical protein